MDNLTMVPECVNNLRNAYSALKTENEQLKKIVSIHENVIKSNRETVENFYQLLIERKTSIMKHIKREEDDWKSKVKEKELLISELEKELELEKSKNALDQKRHDLELVNYAQENDKECEEKIKIEKEKFKKEFQRMQEFYKRETEKQDSEMKRLRELLRNLRNKKPQFENVYPTKPVPKKQNHPANRFPALNEVLGNDSQLISQNNKKRKLFRDNPDEIVDLP